MGPCGRTKLILKKFSFKGRRRWKYRFVLYFPAFCSFVGTPFCIRNEFKNIKNWMKQNTWDWKVQVIWKTRLNANYFCFYAIFLLYKVPALASARKKPIVSSLVFQDSLLRKHKHKNRLTHEFCHKAEVEEAGKLHITYMVIDMVRQLSGVNGNDNELMVG